MQATVAGPSYTLPNILSHLRVVTHVSGLIKLMSGMMLTYNAVP